MLVIILPQDYSRPHCPRGSPLPLPLPLRPGDPSGGSPCSAANGDTATPWWSQATAGGTPGPDPAADDALRFGLKNDYFTMNQIQKKTRKTDNH